MYNKNECVAMLLAGGKGTRLGVLTEDRAKPAVPFGGQNRLIDYTLSNCINSNLTTIGVLTQYKAKELNSYISDNYSDYFDMHGGNLEILQAGYRISGVNYYSGTADAIYQNIQFIERSSPKYVIVLSGDHIYKMDYRKMLEFHKQNNADCTISTVSVPLEEASNFGILNIRNDYSVYEFEEKPALPKSRLASMGIYVFTWDKLRQYLCQDCQHIGSSHDFGKDLIPLLVRTQERVFAYPFEGYWRDVGTISSLWAANMDLLSPYSEMRRTECDWPVYPNRDVDSTHFITSFGNIKNTLLMRNCTISGSTERSIICEGVHIEAEAEIYNSIIFPNAYIGKRAKIRNAIIAENVDIGEDSRIGADSVTVIGKDVKIGRRTTIAKEQEISLMKIV